VCVKPKRLGIGILGYGRFAEKWAVAAIQNSKHARLVAIQVRSRSVAINGVSAYKDVDGFLRDPHLDAVYVTSPNQFHEEHAIRCLKAGKHVLSEKPLCVLPSQGRRMIQAARRTRRYLAAGHMLRFSPALQKIKSLVDEEKLGRVLYVRADFAYDLNTALRTWAYKKSLAGGGVLIDGGIHALDSLRYVLGQEPVEVVACVLDRVPSKGLENGAACLLQFPRGAFAQISTHSEATYGSSLEVVGTRGRLRLDGFVRCLGHVTLRGEWDARGKTRTTRQVFDVHRIYEDQIDAFCRAALTHPQALTSAQNGLKNVEIIQALYKRSR
jgi:1,5-anhydro-D-fructose reductase (1,5-anhydro-D-mannitol-forming)